MDSQPQQIIRLPDVLRLTSLGRTRLDELVQQGRFPPPIRLSVRRKGWVASEVAGWIANRIKDRDGRQT